jgi:3-phosphoshikimate 1-carboxyvinyltransferase
VVGELISRPYIEITLNLLPRFGVQVQARRLAALHHSRWLPLQSPGDLHVEADASSASYFIALGAIATRAGWPNRITYSGCGSRFHPGRHPLHRSRPHDGRAITSGPNWLRGIAPGPGRLKAIDLDCNHIPDAAMTLAVMASVRRRHHHAAQHRQLARQGDRPHRAMATELRKFGATVEEGPDFIRITPPASAPMARSSIHTYDDHRVAMCFSLAAFNPAGLPVRIEDPKCVAKTFPDYFEALFSVATRRWPPFPVICVDGPTASGKGTLAAVLAQRWVTTSWIPARCTASPPWPPCAPDLALDAAGEGRHCALVGTPCRSASPRPCLLGARMSAKRSAPKKRA